MVRIYRGRKAFPGKYPTMPHAAPSILIVEVCQFKVWEIDGRKFVRVFNTGGKTQAVARLMMECFLERTLSTDETAHHVNHDKRDDRPDNPMVMSTDDHLRHHAMTRK